MKKRSCPARRDRGGAVVLEFALCAPLLFLIFFAALEFTRANMLRQSIENAVYEGARRGIVPGATVDEVVAEAQSVLNAVATRNASVTVSPTVITADTLEVTVSVSVPLNDNAWITPKFLKDRLLTSSLTLARERYDTMTVP